MLCNMGNELKGEAKPSGSRPTKFSHRGEGKLEVVENRLMAVVPLRLIKIQSQFTPSNSLSRQTAEVDVAPPKNPFLTKRGAKNFQKPSTRVSQSTHVPACLGCAISTVYVNHLTRL